MNRARDASTHNTEETEILRVAKEVASHAGIESFFPKRVVWRDEVAPGECQFVRRHFGIIVLPKSLTGRLHSEEWRPLLASSIMITKVPGQRRFAAAMTLLSVTLLLGLFAPSQVIPPSWSQVLAAAIGLPTVVFMLLRLFAWLWRAMLEADIMAARLVGREELLEVLRKIDSFGLPETERVKQRRRLKRFGRPSLTDRIENLQASVVS